MTIQRFVFGSSLLLVCWLSATFFHEVPADRYPKRDKNSMNLTVVDPTDAEAEKSALARAEGAEAISISN